MSIIDTLGVLFQAAAQYERKPSTEAQDLLQTLRQMKDGTEERPRLTMVDVLRAIPAGHYSIDPNRIKRGDGFFCIQQLDQKFKVQWTSADGADVKVVRRYPDVYVVIRETAKDRGRVIDVEKGA